MDIVKLGIISNTDIINVFGRVISKKPLKIKLSSDYSEEIKNALTLKIQWSEKNKIYESEIINEGFENNNIYIFETISKNIISYERNFCRVDYKGFFYLLPINSSNKSEIERYAYHKTHKIKSAFANKIRQLLLNDRTSEKYILQYLLEIDSKIDKILDLIDKKEDSIFNFITVNSIDISGGGLSFFSTEKFEENQELFVEGKLDDITNKIEFIAFLKITNVINTSKGFIYSAIFNKIDDEFSENIIKYVFEKERKLIQDFKKK
jgi:hypothetical protein